MTEVDDQMRRTREAKAAPQPKKAAKEPAGQPADPKWTAKQVKGQRILALCEKDCSEAHEQGAGFVVFDAVCGPRERAYPGSDARPVLRSEWRREAIRICTAGAPGPRASAEPPPSY